MTTLISPKWDPLPPRNYRFNQEGHAGTCDAVLYPHVEHHDGNYRALWRCGCGFERRRGKLHVTYAEAQEEADA